jgi:predicted alpha-1,2-mannosidase
MHRTFISRFSSPTRSFLFAVLACPALASSVLHAKDPVDYVNPLIGAASSRATSEESARMKDLDPNFAGFHGKMFPGATTPDGMVQLSPDTIIGGDNGAGYSYPNFTIQGFSFQHLSGVGAYGDLGNFLVTPTTGPLKTWYGDTDKPGSGYLSAYSKDTQVAQAGYYAVTLDDYNIRAEMTAAPHSGILRFTFPQNPKSRIQIDLAHRIGGTSLHQRVKVVGDNAIEGQIDCTGKGGGWMHGKISYTLYYHAEFSRPFRDYGVWSATLPPGPYNLSKPSPAFAAACASAQVFPGVGEKEGQHLGFYSEFPTQANDTVLLKAGISYVSIANARLNLQTEIPGWNFDGVRQKAHQIWAKAMDRLAVEGGTEDQKTAFYTAYYHGLIDPRNDADVNGQYMGGDNKVHETRNFIKRTVFSGWDVERSLFPLLTLISPNIVNDQINSAVELADQNGTHYYDRWELMNCYTGCMDGSPEVVVINDAYQKGIRNFDVEKAYQYAVNTCEKNGVASTGSHGLAQSLQNAFDDWNLSQLAAALGHKEDAAKYANLALTYRDFFDASVPWTYDKAGKTGNPAWKGWFRSKEKNGAWSPWGGLTSGYGGEESTVFQTGWFVPQDVPGLAALLGGNQGLVDRLEDFYERSPQPLNRSSPYNDATNEPSNLIPFLFNRAGAPWLTQKWVRAIATQAYSGKVNGMPGDDDEGQISSWFVLAASGLHQACPGDPRFEIFTPLFDKITITIPPEFSKGATFVVSAKNNSPENIYIQSATLNGQPLNRCWLSYQEIIAGGTLEFVLGPRPNAKWGIE